MPPQSTTQLAPLAPIDILPLRALLEPLMPSNRQSQNEGVSAPLPCRSTRASKPLCPALMAPSSPSLAGNGEQDGLTTGFASVLTECSKH